MIDYDLINECVDSMSVSMQRANKVKDQLLFVDNVFPQPVIDKIQTLLGSELDWKTVWRQPDTRKMIDWIPDSVIEELHEVGELLTIHICECFDILNIKFQALQLWKDCDHYDLGTHMDNPVIDVAMQIYLFNDKQSEGTTFMIQGNPIDLPFKQNTGYVLWKKSTDQRIPHRPTSVITGSDRVTLYLTWSRFGKQAPDADNPAALL